MYEIPLKYNVAYDQGLVSFPLRMLTKKKTKKSNENEFILTAFGWRWSLNNATCNSKIADFVRGTI